MKVLLIVPAYNEEENIVRVCNNLRENFSQYDFVVINDGSSDNTLKLCEDNHFPVISLPVNLGLAGGFQTGMKYAYRTGYDCAVQFDADGQHRPEYIAAMIRKIEEGNDIALVSDAGYPAISDPGYELVKEAIEHEINVVPISGCNACLDALVVSGIAPQPFMFYGFLDHLDKKKKKELIDLKKYKETIVFYESPHRIKKTLNLMLDILGDRNIALCREITKKHEEIIRGHISEIISILEELKGEMVIVVEGSQEVEEEITFETTIKEDVDMYIEKGMSTKDAIKEVAKQRNLNKNSVYQEYHSK